MPYAADDTNDKTWQQGRRFRALGLSGFFLLQASPVLANGAAGGWNGTMGGSPHVFSQHLQNGHGAAGWTHFAAGQYLSGAGPLHQALFMSNMANGPVAHNLSLPSQGLNLDLTSSIANIILGTNLFAGSVFSSATVDVGGAKQTFQAGQKVTAAEYVAISEVLSGGAQTLTVNHRGAASGGSIDLSQVSTLKASEVVIAKHVTAMDNFANSSIVSFSGDLLNYGSIQAVSTNSKVTSGTISAADIINERGGVITTLLPGGSKGAGTAGDISLTLSADNNIVNSGQVISSGALTLSAGSGNFVNSGLLASNHGNVNFTVPVAQNININGKGGTVQALAGNINVRDASYAGAGNVNLNGGDYLSQNVNIYAGTGAITGSVGNVTGNFNSIADSAHVLTDAAVLKLGSNTISGDPLFVNDGGDIDITGPVNVTGSGEPLTIIASGDIKATDPSASLTNNGGAITLVAGANVTYGGSTASTLPGGAQANVQATVDLTQGSASGGSIDLTASTAATVIDTSKSTIAGNVTLVAYANSGGTRGNILLSSNSLINASSSNGSGGNVSIISAAPTGNAIQVGNIDTSPKPFVGNAGNILVTNALPTGDAGGSSITYNTNGTVSGSSVAQNIISSRILHRGNISAGNLVTGTFAATSFNNTPTATVSTGGSGNITFTGSANPVAVIIDIAAGGTLSLSQTAGANVAALPGILFSHGGVINVQASQIVLDANSNTIFDASSQNGLGGRITLNVAGSGLTVGSANGQASFTTTSTALGGQIFIGAAGALTVDPSAIVANGVGSSPLVSITLFGQSINQVGSSPLSAGTVSLTATGGDVGSKATPILTATQDLTANASGNVFVQNIGAVSLIGTSGAGAAGSFNLTNNIDGGGNGQIVIANGATITAGTVNMKSNGTALDGSKGGIAVFNNQTDNTDIFAPNINLSDGNGAGGTGAGTIQVVTDQGATPGSFNVNTNGDVQIFTNSLTTAKTDTISGGSVSIFGQIGQNLTINNQGNITSTAGLIDISASPDGKDVGGSLFIKGGGTMSSTAQLFLVTQISADGLSNNVLEFTGDQTFATFVAPQASGVNQAVIVDKGVTVTAAALPFGASIDSPLFINNGALVGNFLLTSPTLAGTYASSSTIDLNTLAGHLSFPGQSLTILSGGDITDSAFNTISLMNPTGDGGNLTLLAGFTFNPSAGLGGSPDTITTFNITATGSGNVNLSNSTLDTRSLSGGNGGSVSVYANGSVFIGSITTNAGSPGGNGGALTIIGTSVSVGNLNTSGATGGNVNLSATTLALNSTQGSGTISVNNGFVYGGSFIPGAGSHNISVFGAGGINATGTSAGSTVTLNVPAGGASVPGGIFVGVNGSLVATTGVNGFGSQAAPIKTDAAFITANAGSFGKVNIVDVIAGPQTFTIIGSNAGLSYSVQGTSTAGVFNSLKVDSGATINAQTVSLGNVDGLTVSTANGIGANSLTLAANGTLNLASTIILVSQDATNNGGTINLSAKNIIAGGPLTLNASGTLNGDGGSISVTTSDPTATMTVGTSGGTGFIVQALAPGGSLGGNGGKVSLSSGNKLIVDTDAGGSPFGASLGINAAPQGSDGSGAKISLQGDITWTSDHGGTFVNTPLLLNVNGVGTGDGGSISVTQTTGAAIKIQNVVAGFVPSAKSGPTGGNGGAISFSAGSIKVDPTLLTVAPQNGNGKGGSISLTATAAGGITTFSGPLILNEDGLGTGSGGTIFVSMPASTTAAIIGTTGTNQFQFSANAGPTGGLGGTLGNGGKITFINGGDVTVNPAQITVNSAGSDGAGGIIDVEAGQAGSGKLLVSSSLNAIGAGNGVGGSITLVSNSTTAMVIGTAKPLNGTVGTLNVAGGTGLPAGAPGSITIKNDGGALTVTQPLTVVGSVDLETGKNGTLTVSNNLGSAATNSITLSTVLGGATGGKISAKVLQAGAVNVSTGTQALTLSLSTSDLTVLAKGNVTATTTATAPALLNIDGIAGPSSTAAGTISFSSAGNIQTQGAVSGTVLTLKSTGKAGTITIGSGGPLTASTGAITLTGPGGVAINGTITDTALKGTLTITAAGAGAIIADNAGGNLTAGGAVALTATKGTISQNASNTIKSTGSTVTLTAANLIAASGTLNGLTGVTIKSTALKAADGIKAATLTSANGPITLTAAGNILVSGVVQSGTIIKETAGTNGTVINTAAIKALGSKGAITLSAPGATGAITTDDIVDATTTVTMTAANGITTTTGAVTAGTNATLTASGITGAIKIGSGGLTATNGAVVLAGADGVQITGAVTAGTTVKMTSTVASSDVTIGASVTATGSKGTVTLTSSGAGDNVVVSDTVTTTGAAVLSAAKGGITLSDAVTSNKSAVTLTAGNSINETGSIAAGTSATLKTTIVSTLAANTLSVNNITTNNGPISIIGAGSRVIALAGGHISANSAVLKPIKATVLIESSNTKDSIPASQIEIESGSRIDTGGPLGGNVSISVGAPTAVFGKAPAAGDATFRINGTATPPVAGGPFFFGNNGITISGSTDPLQTIFNSKFTAPAKAPQIILNTGKAPATAIQIDAGSLAFPTIITADPMPVMTAPPLVAPHSLSLTSTGVSPNNQVSLPPAGSTSTVANSSSAGDIALASISPNNASLLSTVNAGLAGSNATAFISGRPALTGFDQQTSGTSMQSRTVWISDTEIASGAIPAILYGGSTLGINPEVSSVIEIEESQSNALLGVNNASAIKYQSADKRSALTGAVSEDVGKGKTVTLRRGSVVFAPTERTLVRTPFGHIAIDAKSLVLIISYARGVAVYDLDDRHAGAVVVQSGGRSIGLTPGRSVVVTSDRCDRFEEINPAQRVAYRKVRACDLADGRKAFAAEFSAMSAAAAVLPLRQLLTADHHEARRIANSLLKTTAIVAQMQGASEQYRHYLRPSLTASAR